MPESNDWIIEALRDDVKYIREKLDSLATTIGEKADRSEVDKIKTHLSRYAGGLSVLVVLIGIIGWVIK